MTDDEDASNFHWAFEKGDLEQGAWSISDPALKKVAVILPVDRARPIETGANAMLMLRPFGSERWDNDGVHDLGGAMSRGNAHAQQYRVQRQAEFTLSQVKREGLEMGSDCASRIRSVSTGRDKGRER